MSGRQRLSGWRGVAALAALSIAMISSSPGSAADTAPAASVHLETLSAEQRAFIDNEGNLRRFGLTRGKLDSILAGRDADAVKATITSMMETMEAAKYQPATDPQPEGQSLLDPVGDMPAVPLNPEAGDFNAGTIVRPAILDEVHRDPGPFSLKRYVDETDGIPTFAGAPVALRKEDLVAGKVEVAFVGVPLDLGSGWRDSQNAPTVMRAMYGTGGYDIFGGIDPAVELNLADYGNLSTDRMSAEQTVIHVRKMIGEMVDAKVIPFIVGGDHTVMFPTVASMADKFGAGNVSVLQLDAHYDAARDLAHFYSDDQAVSGLLKQGLVKGKDIVQVGVRGADLKSEDLEWMREQGLHYHTMAEIESSGWEKVLETALKEVKNGPPNVFVSFDVSVLDPAYATGAGRPAPGGLTMREAVPMVRRICAETRVVGFEMLDVAPFLDLSYATALNANYIMHACLTGIAMRKLGMTKLNYVSPLTAGDGK